MLDDQNWITNLDPAGTLDIAAGQASQLATVFDISDLKTPKNIVMGGMGGSTLAGIVLKSWLNERLGVPFEVVREYALPGYVDENTLFIAASYSGNTEETLTQYKEAKERGVHIIAFARGGKLKDWAETDNVPFVEIPAAEQPRYAVFNMLVVLATILEKAGFGSEYLQDLRSAEDFVAETAGKFAKTVPSESNMAKQLAKELAGKSMVIFGGPLMKAAAYKWKISFNENAKNVAFWNEWPEFSHNEFIGWSSHPIEKVFGIVELVSSFEHPRIKTRYEISNRLLSGKMPEPHVLEAEGRTPIEQLLWGVVLGDFVTLYVALLNGVNPEPVVLVEKLKVELAKKGEIV